MKAALIPPFGYERTALQSDIHLILPLEACRTNIDYMNTYRSARERNDYLILDNGCAEGDLVDNKTLMAVAAELGVHEIVAPDVMGNAEETYDLTKAFVEENRSATDYNIMGVLQGESLAQVLYLAAAFAKIPQITTFGIPKVHINNNEPHTRAQIANELILRYGDKFKIHLLGLNNSFPTEMLDIKFPANIRSMDSAQPYKMAELGVVLTAYNARKHHPKRRTDYFSRKRAVNEGMLMYNIEQFKAWCL